MLDTLVLLKLKEDQELLDSRMDDGLCSLLKIQRCWRWSIHSMLRCLNWKQLKKFTHRDQGKDQEVMEEPPQHQMQQRKSFFEPLILGLQQLGSTYLQLVMMHQLLVLILLLSWNFSSLQISLVLIA